MSSLPGAAHPLYSMRRTLCTLKRYLVFLSCVGLLHVTSATYSASKIRLHRASTFDERLTTSTNTFLRKRPAIDYRCGYDEDIVSRGHRFNTSCGPWRVAVSFRGTIRGRCNEHLDRFIYSLPHSDVYVHHWLHPETEYIQHRYQPTRFKTEEPSVVEPAVALFEVSKKAPQKEAYQKALVPFFWSISKSLKLVADEERHKNFTYDLVISLRWDLGIDHIGPLFFPWLCPDTSKLYSQFGPELNWAWYDQWFYSSSQNMKNISRITEAFLNGELIPRKGDPENEYVNLLRTGVPYSDAADYWSNAVLSSVELDRPLMTSSDVERDIWNVHLVWKIFLSRLNLINSTTAMYCTDRAFEEYWRKRQLPDHGYFPWSNSPSDSSPNCVSEDSYFTHDPIKAKRGVRASALSDSVARVRRLPHVSWGLRALQDRLQAPRTSATQRG